MLFSTGKASHCHNTMIYVFDLEDYIDNNCGWLRFLYFAKGFIFSFYWNYSNPSCAFLKFFFFAIKKTKKKSNPNPQSKLSPRTYIILPRGKKMIELNKTIATIYIARGFSTFFCNLKIKEKNCYRGEGGGIIKIPCNALHNYGMIPASSCGSCTQASTLD